MYSEKIRAVSDAPHQRVARPSFWQVTFLLGILALTPPASTLSDSRLLQEGWVFQSSAQVSGRPESLSVPGFNVAGWHKAQVPGTVFGSLVTQGVYPDPYFGMNLRSVPGVSYSIGENFSNSEMPAGSPFAVSWWYRTEFDLSAEWGGTSAWLAFDGINYRANVWLNGHRVASSDEVIGTFRRFEFDVTAFVTPGAKNALAVEIFAPRRHDLGLTWVDWNPAPPDKDMGLWGAVRLERSGPAALRFPFVRTRLESASLEWANLTVQTEVVNATDRSLSAEVSGEIDGTIAFSQPTTLAPKERRIVTFDPDRFPELRIHHPKLWWPYRMGPPDLHDLSMRVSTGGEASDEQKVRFGISEITSELQGGSRLFKVNGRPLLIRGGGWSPDMMLRFDPGRLETEFRYVRAMNLNTIRLEGKLEREEFFDLADRYGILVMAGWCCCDQWEKWGQWKAANHSISARSLEDQSKRLRTHPSVLVWLNGSDNPPPPAVEQAYLDVLKNTAWPKPILSSATGSRTRVTGDSGVKMTGPYDYVPPSYWLQDKGHGGAFGFNTETSPGPAIPPLESLRTMLPADHLWPIDRYWDYHTGGGPFGNLHLFTAALEHRYGKARDVADYTRKAQAMAYEGERAMFEAFGARKYTATGVIQWMLNNAWPSLIWHLYDYYLRPGGGFFGVKKACEPLHPQLSYSDRSVVVVNDSPQGFTGLKLKTRVLDLRSDEVFSKESVLDVAPDAAVRVLELPEKLPSKFFVRLDLADAQGRGVSSNFYWLTSKPDVLDWEQSNWYYTPMKTHEDLSSLADLPPTELQVTSESTENGSEGVTRVHLRNVGKALAFQVRLKVLKGPGGSEFLPVFWDDNYLSLLPGEERVTEARYPTEGPKAPVVEVEAWNARVEPF